jgi:hypothetical protein
LSIKSFTFESKLDNESEEEIQDHKN